MRSRGPRIAIIDDDPVSLKKLEDRVESRGWQAYATDDYSRAARFVARVQPDLVIIDFGRVPERAAWHMLDVLKRTRETAGIPVIMCSVAATALRGHAGTLRQYGVAVLAKPYRAADMLRKAAILLRRRRGPTPSHPG